MKNLRISALLLLFAAISCSKDEDPTPVPPIVDKYMSLTPASTWNYEMINNISSTTSSFTVVSIDKDSSINGKTYHVYSNSSGSGNEYYNISSNDYLNFRSLPASLGGTSVENIYLKDNVAVNTSWNQSYAVTLAGFPANVTVTNTLAEKGLVKVVNNVTYNDVIRIVTTLAVSVSGVPLPSGAITTNILSFYAPKVGMIQSVNKIDVDFSGMEEHTDQQTNLKSADIK